MPRFSHIFITFWLAWSTLSVASLSPRADTDDDINDLCDPLKSERRFLRPPIDNLACSSLAHRISANVSSSVSSSIISSLAGGAAPATTTTVTATVTVGPGGISTITITETPPQSLPLVETSVPPKTSTGASTNVPNGAGTSASSPVSGSTNYPDSLKSSSSNGKSHHHDNDDDGGVSPGLVGAIVIASVLASSILSITGTLFVVRYRRRGLWQRQLHADLHFGSERQPSPPVIGHEIPSRTQTATGSNGWFGLDEKHRVQSPTITEKQEPKAGQRNAAVSPISEPSAGHSLGQEGPANLGPGFYLRAPRSQNSGSTESPDMISSVSALSSELGERLTPLQQLSTAPRRSPSSGEKRFQLVRRIESFKASVQRLRSNSQTESMPQWDILDGVSLSAPMDGKGSGSPFDDPTMVAEDIDYEDSVEHSRQDYNRYNYKSVNSAITASSAALPVPRSLAPTPTPAYNGTRNRAVTPRPARRETQTTFASLAQTSHSGSNNSQDAVETTTHRFLNSVSRAIHPQVARLLQARFDSQQPQPPPISRFSITPEPRLGLLGENRDSPSPLHLHNPMPVRPNMVVSPNVITIRTPGRGQTPAAGQGSRVSLFPRD